MEPSMIQVVLIGVAAFIGAIITAFLGWTESSESFDVKKFTSSIVRSLVAAVGIAAAWDYMGNIGPVSYLLAVLAGAGVDVGGNRVAAAIAARLK